MGRVFGQSGQVREAEQILTEAVSIDETNISLRYLCEYHLACLLTSQNRHEEALPHYLMAQVYLSTYLEKLSVEDRKKYATHKTQLNYNLALTYQYVGNHGEALTAWLRQSPHIALNSDPQYPYVFIPDVPMSSIGTGELLLLTGEFYHRAGMFVEAQGCYERLLSRPTPAYYIEFNLFTTPLDGKGINRLRNNLLKAGKGEPIEATSISATSEEPIR